MVRLSSDWTLFYKFFLPTVWISFFGVATGVFVITIRSSLPLQAGALIFYALGILVLAVTVLPLKRVEGEAEHLYVTNYFKTFRYTFDSISRIRTIDFFIFKIVHVYFNEKSSFGRRIYFIRRRGIWDEYLQSHPELAQLATQKN